MQPALELRSDETIRSRAAIRLPEDHVISFMIAIGKPTKAAWPRGKRFPDSEVVIRDRFA